MTRSNSLWILVVSVLVSSVAPVLAQLENQSRETHRQVTVQGQGKVQGIPDIATLHVEVSQEGVSLDALTTGVRKAMGSVQDRLRKESIADKDLQTELYQVTPRYEQDKRGNAHRNGYRVANRISVKVRDLKKVGRLLAVATEAGATDVIGPEFDVDNPAVLEREALAKAMDDAKAKAAVLAQTAGATLGEIVTIQQQNAVWPTPRPYMAMKTMALADAPASEPIAVGEQTVQATITASFSLK